MSILDHQLIRTLRQARGYTARQLADHLGATSQVTNALEDGTNHADLPLRLIVRLADLLGVPAGRLFADQLVEDADGELVRKVGAILHTVDQPIRIEAIAELCDTDLPAVRQAVETLKQQVRTVGGVVAESDDGLSLHADQQSVDDTDTVVRTVRWVHARHGLSPSEARILDQHRQGKVVMQQFNADDHIAYARLRNAGLVDGEGQTRHSGADLT